MKGTAGRAILSGVVTVLGALALGAAGSGVVAAMRAEGEFPHSDHEGLFPLCSGCHAGIETTATSSEWYPEPESCVACHDGVREDPVVWTGPTRDASNLSYLHSDHERRLTLEGDSATCSSCHQDAADPGRMSVVPAEAESCLSCHAHEAPEHLAVGRDCASCHMPLWEATGLSPSTVEAIERPETHGESGFLSNHDPRSDLELTSCATCHARESCERCHFNSPSSVAALGRDQRIATMLLGTVPEYSEPASHAKASWQWLHGGAAEEAGANCANCHSRPGCESCHTAGSTAVVTALPALEEDDTRGVSISESASAVHPAGFSTAHGAAATALESSCASCHTESTCSSCHEGASSPAFHVGNFLQSHAADAYGNEVECATCHNTEVFCRSCHSEVGLAATGRAGGTAFHDARPQWLLGHGLAARQGLESCTTCHSQSYCLQCHSAVGGWRINPHGPEFDPVRAQDSQAKSTCAQCHRTGTAPP